MSDVSVIAAPDLAGCRLAPLLTEHRVGHYDEFRRFLVGAFDLDRVGLAAPGFVRAPSGRAYAFVFTGRSGEPFPTGVEIAAVLPALEPLDEAGAHRDVWAILRWLVAGAGPPWTVADLDATGRLYRLPEAS